MLVRGRRDVARRKDAMVEAIDGTWMVLRVYQIPSCVIFWVIDSS